MKKCPYCTFRSKWPGSVSRHIRTKATAGDLKHKAHYAHKVKVAKQPAKPGELSLEAGPDKVPADRGAMSLSEPPQRGGETSPAPDTAPSDDISKLELPPPGEEPEYVAPGEVMPEAIPAPAEVPFENFEALFATVYEMSAAFATGDLDSIKKLKKADFEFIAKFAARRRGSDLPDTYALAIVGAKFAMIVGWNLILGVQKVLAKNKERKEKALKEKAEKEKAAAERKAKAQAVES